MKTEIMAAVCIEVAVTIAVLFFFLKDIADRLKILIANAQLLPREQPLSQRVSGSDELAYLDQVLHDAASSLQRAAEHKRSLMQMVAHDLRSPLMSARLLTEQLISAARGGDPELTSRLQELQRTSSLVIGFVEDLLTVDKLEAGKLELDWDSIEIADVMRESIQQMSRLAQQKKVTIHEQIHAARVLGDHRRLLQVVNNLISNAIKYSFEGDEVIVSSVMEDSHMKVRISDHGPGIEADKRDKLFNKYYQSSLKDSAQGFGLGLAICNLIVIEHNGAIGVESAPGKGSTFWFTVPLDKDVESGGGVSTDPEDVQRSANG